MKKTLYFIALFLIFTNCKLLNKESYYFPEAMLPKVQKDYLEMCNKGKTLYELNCSMCHNTGRRKQIVPNFSKSQLVGYTLRVSNLNHEKSIPDSLVSEEELGYVMYYLEYRKH